MPVGRPARCPARPVRQVSHTTHGGGRAGGHFRLRALPVLHRTGGGSQAAGSASRRTDPPPPPATDRPGAPASGRSPLPAQPRRPTPFLPLLNPNPPRPPPAPHT